MRRGVPWIYIGLALAAAAYAVVGAIFSSRYDEKVAAFRASEVYAELERRREDVPAEENAAPLLAAASEILVRFPDEYAMFKDRWGPQGLDEAEGTKALRTMEPFFVAVASALERPVVQYPVGRSAASDARNDVKSTLPFRAELLPERAAESADALLRLATRWRARSYKELLEREWTVLQALKIVRDILARDPEEARSHGNAWQAALAAEDPLSEGAVVLRLDLPRVRRCGRAGQARRGSASRRGGSWGSTGTGRETWELPGSSSRASRCAWDRRPQFYGEVISACDRWTEAIDAARTEEGVRALLGQPEVSPFLREYAAEALAQLAVLRLARTALAVAAGQAVPELRDPLTGKPLAVRRGERATVITATPPEEGVTIDTNLFSWEVAR